MDKHVHFNKLLDKFNIEHNLIRQTLMIDTFLPEGEEWLINLQSGKNLYVSRCSYEVKNPEVKYIWVDYKKENGVILEINYVDGSKKVFVLISPTEIRE